MLERFLEIWGLKGKGILGGVIVWYFMILNGKEVGFSILVSVGGFRS